jgi:hypothetical protein
MAAAGGKQSSAKDAADEAGVFHEVKMDG